MIQFRAREESGAETTIRASSLEEAIREAKAWVQEGDYPTHDDDGEPLGEITTWCRVWDPEQEENGLSIGASFSVRIES